MSDSLLTRLKQRARSLKNEAFAVHLAARDPRTPWYATALVFFVVAHTFSHMDLIPDFIPAEVLAKARLTAARQDIDRSVGTIGAAIIVLLWIVGLSATVYLILRYFERI